MKDKEDTSGQILSPDERKKMFGDFFDNDLTKTLSNPIDKQECSEHKANPNTIKANAELHQPFIIYQFRPAFALQLYLRFLKCPYRVKNLEYASLETSGPLPVLIDGQFILPEVEVIAYFRNHYPHFDLDKNLPERVKAQIEAFGAIVKEKLGPYLRASRYRDEANYTTNVKSIIFKASRFPISNLICYTERKRGLQEQTYRGLTDNHETLKNILTRSYHQYQQLDRWLDSSPGKFFFGDSPTSFDCDLFGHLAEALVDINVVVFLTTQKNLMAFFRRIAEDYFRTETNPIPRVPEDVLTWWRHADYINSQNVFNQVEEAKVCAQAPIIPEPRLIEKFLEMEQARPPPPSSMTEEEKEAVRTRRKENILWFSVVGGIMGLLVCVKVLGIFIFAALDIDEDQMFYETDES